MNQILAVIPARFASTRFPGKPLVEILGKSMIRRVYEQVCRSSVDQVVVATDDPRIADHVAAFDGHVVMTSPDHASGTDRCAEVLNRWNPRPAAIINVQGDEPLIAPQAIDLLANALRQDPGHLVTLANPIRIRPENSDPNQVKVVLDAEGFALYFSRAPVPFSRSGESVDAFRHVGLYGYPSDILREISQLPVSRLERIEQLEQLRWLEQGYRIRVIPCEYESLGVDVPEDLPRVIARISKETTL